MQGKAVIFTDRRKVAFQDVSIPDPGPADVVVDTRYSWISNGTEGSFLRGERINGETPYLPGDPWPFPIAAGYQSTGVVTQAGPEVQGVAVGDWVFIPMGYIEGMFERAGGHISPKVFDYRMVIPLIEGVTPVAASGLVLTQVGYNCGMRAPVNPGDVAVVIGDGLVGQWSAQTLRWRGAKVILAGKHPDRLAFFPEDDQCLHANVADQSLITPVRALAPEGVKILVDTVGDVDTVMHCMPALQHDSHMVSAGFNGTNCMVDVQKLRFKEVSWHSPSGLTMDRMRATMQLMAEGYLWTEPLITHRFPVARAADAWKLILERTEPVLGVLLEWEG